MRALIRNEGEIILEEYDIPGIDWNSGKPLTSESWIGGPYTLIIDYREPIPEEESSE